MSAATINFVAIAAGGLLAVPSLLNLFNKPNTPANTIVVTVGFGDVNSSEPVPQGKDLKGPAPRVSLYDINGREIGAGFEDKQVLEGGAIEIKMTGGAGTEASRVPAYISMSAVGLDDPICVSWLTTTSSSSSNGDFRSWNAATARACNIPWYPSVAPFGGVGDLFQPPCVWLSPSGADGFPVGMSARLTDFFFPGASESAVNKSMQWNLHPDTLCNAPARQQFYKNMGLCIPYYPSGDPVINQKDPETGFDLDFDKIKNGHTKDCDVAGVPFNNVDLGAGVPDPKLAELESIIATASLQSTVVVGLGKRRATATATATAEPTALVTELAKMAEQKKESGLNKRCRENHLVITESEAHSAKDLCASESSWGPDMASVNDGSYCDMCERKVYPICAASKERRMTVGHTCFDLKMKQLRVIGKVSRSERDAVPVKAYQVVKHWK
ncbi:hypothetical protein B0H66DRAFT_636576 [Apodospora peruviana]|uniref:Uncharacterized protein n=1 Tax=Apodospora peruviana TaxID=516989 RepID=A0AAE0MBL8_9PEZI|nr:hypothetical protein B0H66DRAFT_636576 [Apodospora peruviana]